ncbi:MAG: sigma-70 family RNA polymerase sigma factor [Spirillospora sp.]
MQTVGGVHSEGVDFRARNGELFAQRRSLITRLAVLRGLLDKGDRDARTESALGRAEQELEDVTYEIVEANLGLVRKYVMMFTSASGQHAEDFESAGKVGLLWAISSYDPARGSFANWAFKPIQREVLRAVRDADHPNLNPGDFEKRPAILAAERACLEEAGPAAPVGHAVVARRAGVTEAQVSRVLTPPRLETLHSPFGDPTGDDSALADWLADGSPSTEDRVLAHLDLSAIGRQLPKLDHRERYVLARRFGLDGEPEQTLRAIGQWLGLSREGVRLIEQKALAKLAATVAIAATVADTSPGVPAERAGQAR